MDKMIKTNLGDGVGDFARYESLEAPKMLATLLNTPPSSTQTPIKTVSGLILNHYTDLDAPLDESKLPEGIKRWLEGPDEDDLF